MAMTRREFLARAACFTCGTLAGRAKPPDDPLRAAAGFLAGRQSRDGAWRSDRYAAFRNGDALTPVVLWAVRGMDSDAFGRGLRWLEALTDSESRRSETVYPLFTAGYAAQVFVACGDRRRAGIWADLIESLRIRAELGWPAGSAACGAWGDSAKPPRLPPGVNPPPDMLAPNLSATVLAVQALHAAGRPTEAALPFIASCQNFSASAPGGFDDGGFFFAPDDPVRNKAGIAGRDASTRYRSYGSATCDGVQALRACGIAWEHPRLRAAVDWLRAHSKGLRHSGSWPRERQGARESLRFYFAQGLAAVGTGYERDALAGELREGQAPDGSWTGPAPDSCEDEPLLATAFAARALGQLAYPN